MHSVLCAKSPLLCLCHSSTHPPGPGGLPGLPPAGGGRLDPRGQLLVQQEVAVIFLPGQENLLTLPPRVSGRQLVGLVHGVEPRLLLELRDPRDNTAVHRQLVQVTRLLHLGGKRRTRNDPSQQKSFNNRSLFIKQVSRVLYLIDIYRLRERLDERL